jgi:uncharacterized protein (TIGR02466 family)
MIDKIQQYNLPVPDNFIDNIYKLKSTVKTQLRSNKLGWQSQQLKNTDLIPWADDFLNLCLYTIDNKHPIKHIWFNISPPKAYHSWHSHGGSTQAGVYYIKTPANCGSIEFKHKEQLLTIEPYAGLLLTFPAGLEHRVLENTSNEDRIVLAFNLGV